MEVVLLGQGCTHGRGQVLGRTRRRLALHLLDQHHGLFAGLLNSKRCRASRPERAMA